MANYTDLPDLRTLRQRLGLTQAQLAERVGVTFATVNRWENGGARPSRLALRRLRELAVRADEASVVAEPEEGYTAAPPEPDFRADPELVRLVVEAERLTYGHLFSPSFATETSIIDPLPHQRLAVYEHMLVQPRLRFLLADDAGAGKTIMAGLYIREMLSRRLLRRVLVVTPAGLVSNWERELRKLFALPFRIVRGEEARATNPFQGDDSDLLIVSVDTLSGGRMLERFKEPGADPYDLAIFDEAHKLSADRQPDFRVRKTDRYLLAEHVARVCRHLLLLTATPHMGKDYPFYCLWRLLEPDVLSTYQAFQNYPQAARERAFLRRTKEEMVYYDGRRIYPERECRTSGYDLTRPERELYDDTTDYIRSFYNRARILNRSAARLAMSVFQRRLTSSTYALLKSFERRLEKLDELIARLESGELTQDELARMQLRLEALEDPFEERTADEDDPEDGLEGSEAAERKLLSGVVATSLRELREERRRVEGLRNRARQIYEGPEEDSKFEKLRELIQAADFRHEKILIFTEHRDTADFLTRKFEALGFAGQIARIDGTMSTLPGPSGLSERDEQVEFFKKPSAEGGARLMIATDAAGEGINLQFCWLMVNYDIPWNPARLEQRMGRLHRYKQKHDPVVMLNLFAKDTREGNVLETLLDKLEKIRRQLRSDKVFDVVGLQFEGKSLRDIILRAVVDDDEAGALAELEGTLTPEQVQARIDLREKLLKTGGDVKSQLPRLCISLNREELRRLLPGYVRRFVERSAPHLGVRIDGDLDRYFALRGLPEPVLSVLEGYPPEHRLRLTVNRPVEEEKAIFLHPGEPLYESYRRHFCARFARQALRGTVFVDPYAEAPYLFHLGSIAIERRPDPELPEVYGRPEVRAVRLVGLRQAADGRAEESSVEHLMLLRGVPGPLEEAARWSLRAPALCDLARKHIEEAVLGPLVRNQREGLLATVPERERFLMRGFEYQEADLAAMRAALAERARKGDKSAEIELADVKAQQKSLPARRERALAILRREVELIFPSEVRLLVSALVVPSADPAERARHDREIELVAMRVASAHEEALGSRVSDVSTPELALAAGLDRSPGFDLLVHRTDGNERGVEVKGRRGVGDVELTENEWARAVNLRERYWLYVVFDCATASPRLLRVRDPFGRLLARLKGGVVIDERAIFEAAERDEIGRA